jgi:hypothetical protein
MAGLYCAARELDLVDVSAVRDCVPATITSGAKRVAAAAAAATLLLLGVTGFRFDMRSDVYPAASASDAAGQPVLGQAWFSPGPRILSWVGLDPGLASGANLHAPLLVAGVLAVFVCAFALLRIAARLAGTDAMGLAVGTLLVGTSYLDNGHAFVSGAAVISANFTAAQAATAVVALALALALNGSLWAGVALLGLACDAEPAVAVWGAVGLAGASVALARDGLPVARAWLSGGVCALVLAAPAIAWWAAAIAGGGGLLGDPVAALGLREPDLLLAGTVPLQCWMPLGCTLVLGLSAFSVLGSDARVACGAFLGFMVVFAVGGALPSLTDSAWLAILRPIAADTFLQLLATAAAVAVVLRDVRGGGGVLRVALSVAIAVCLLLQRDLLPVAALAMLTRAAAAHGELLGLERRIRDWNQTTLRRAALAAVVLAAVAGGVMQSGLGLP